MSQSQVQELNPMSLNDTNSLIALMNSAKGLRAVAHALESRLVKYPLLEREDYSNHHGCVIASLKDIVKGLSLGITNERINFDNINNEGALGHVVKSLKDKIEVKILINLYIINFYIYN